MAERSVPLTTIKGGITRLRTKGAALNDSLYDLLNGYVTAARTVRVRPGTFRDAVLPLDAYEFTADVPLTKGLCAFDGTLHVFGWEAVAVPAGYTLHVLRHPAGQNNDDTAIKISKIHFAAPFLGFLYVVAEFEEADFDHGLGTVFHFWLQTGSVWEAEKIYKLGDIVTPTVPNGFAYQATRITPANPSWAPNVLRAVGDVIEPTVYNDFFYTVIGTLGNNPVSGATEPDWPEEDGAQIFEEADGTANPTVPSTPQPDPTGLPPPTIGDRYGSGQRPR